MDKMKKFKEFLNEDSSEEGSEEIKFDDEFEVDEDEFEDEENLIFVPEKLDLDKIAAEWRIEEDCDECPDDESINEDYPVDVEDILDVNSGDIVYDENGEEFEVTNVSHEDIELIKSNGYGKDDKAAIKFPVDFGASNVEDFWNYFKKNI